MKDEEEWVSHNGCNTCLNSVLCGHLGSCAILAVDFVYPEYNKKKRDLITRLRNGVCRPDLYAQELLLKVKFLTDPQPKIANNPITPNPAKWPKNREYYGVRNNVEKSYRTWGGGRITLTRLEELFIEELNKPR